MQLNNEPFLSLKTGLCPKHFFTYPLAITSCCTSLFFDLTEHSILDKTYNLNCHMFCFLQLQSWPPLLKSKMVSLSCSRDSTLFHACLKALSCFCCICKAFQILLIWFVGSSLAVAHKTFTSLPQSWRFEMNKILTKGKADDTPCLRALHSREQMVNAQGPLGPHFLLLIGTPSTTSSAHVWSCRMWEVQT